MKTPPVLELLAKLMRYDVLFWLGLSAICLGLLLCCSGCGWGREPATVVPPPVSLSREGKALEGINAIYSSARVIEANSRSEPPQIDPITKEARTIQSEASKVHKEVLDSFQAKDTTIASLQRDAHSAAKEYRDWINTALYGCGVLALLAAAVTGYLVSTGAMRLTVPICLGAAGSLMIGLAFLLDTLFIQLFFGGVVALVFVGIAIWSINALRSVLKRGEAGTPEAVSSISESPSTRGDADED